MFDSINKFQDKLTSGFKPFGGFSSGNNDGTITINGGAHSTEVDKGGPKYTIGNEGQNVVVMPPNGNKIQIQPRSDGKFDVSQYTGGSYRMTFSGFKGVLIVGK